MNKSRQYTFISVLFLALILISAGVGALAAGETNIGLFLLVGGGIILISSLLALYLVKRRSPE